MSVNKRCLDCIKKCKQTDAVIVVACPNLVLNKAAAKRESNLT
jgi:hypothetical protein